MTRATQSPTPEILREKGRLGRVSIRGVSHLRSREEKGTPGWHAFPSQITTRLESSGKRILSFSDKRILKDSRRASSCSFTRTFSDLETITVQFW